MSIFYSLNPRGENFL